MVLKLARFPAILLAFVLLATARPALADQEHNKQQTAEERNEAVPHDMPGMGPMAQHGHGAAATEQGPKTFGGRLFDFLGRMHPFAVHFPIALIPASWLALVLGRRRGHALDVIRAVIILAAVAAVGAALLGWLNAGFALTDRDPIQTWHRWIGTALALVVGAVGLWAWRREEAVNGRAMTWVLGGMTLLLLVQGWLGASLTHGIEHMYF